MIGLILRSRTACAGILAAAVLGGFFTWHRIDSAARVRVALAGHVARSELVSVRAELEEVRRRHAVAETARQRLLSDVEQANADAQAALEELDHYVSTVAETCVVRPGLAERLRER